ncbi:ABC transporter ATP-binding protein [Tissierella sp. MSJ-40]|uniref:ABC transporter ATP-binding protein n=1 Tax=Tissierella simiarum TaxID=2841534 RepID=A0ABS6E976_9FIRM|nr:ABC transporter ATP-binding protein [Tissierella simiarum]MBU5439391.1 ABC transporter ATP-binding protein [Tissierella simiarum]
MDKNILQIEGLVTEFSTSEGKVTAVNNIDLNIKKGKIMGLVGESGCGKSVTSLSIMRLVPKPYGNISKGKILFKDKNLLDLNEEDMRKVRGNDISMIFQEPMTALNPVFTIGYQIGEVLELHLGLKGKENLNRCIGLLEKVGIPRPEKVVHEYPHQLSGGMRQRVMIAMALSCNPELLIADEPTTALDVTIQAQVLEIMKGLSKELNTAILLITHDLGVVAEMCHDVAVMYAGRIVEEGNVKDIFMNPMHYYTKGLMASRPNLVKKGERLKCIPGMVPSLHNMPKGCAFEPRCSNPMDICKEKMPELIEYENGHKVRCWAVEMEGNRNHGR